MAPKEDKQETAFTAGEQAARVANLERTVDAIWISHNAMRADITEIKVGMAGCATRADIEEIKLALAAQAGEKKAVIGIGHVVLSIVSAALASAGTWFAKS
jgi:Zn-dependent alcohol dehydrogenase